MRRFAFAVTVTALTVGLAAAPATADTRLSLPAPTGNRPVGTTSLHLTDTSRPDTWVPSVPYRELMVSLFYPTVRDNGPTKQYMTARESQAYLERLGLPDVPLDVLSTVPTAAVVDARPAGRRHSLPLVVLSPGYTNSRATLTALSEDLASHGYVVAVIDHTYENRAMTFPDGRVVGCDSCAVDDLPGFDEKLAAGRAADVRFVLDRLIGRHPAWRGSNLVDPARVAAGGHSAGGSSSIQAMLADPRIRAAIDVDGSTHAPIPQPGLSRPVMFLGTDQYSPGSQGPYRNWERDWPMLTGWKRWATVAGTAHASFTDLGVFADQLGVDLGTTIDAARATAITRTYVRAFFDQHLRCRPQRLLSAPSSSYPEVVFVG